MKMHQLLLCSLVVFTSQSLMANSLYPLSDSLKGSIFTKMVEDSITHVVLATDFDYFISGRYDKDRPKQEAILTLKNRHSSFEIPVKLELRGRFRRKICDMPPIKVDFPKKKLEAMGLKPKFDELKLVTHCLEDPSSDQTVLREYWTYRLNNELTPNSFKVHLVKIIYLNTSNPTETQERFAFFIENNKELAARMGGEMVDKFGMSPEQMEAKSYHQLVMFNYMVGNLDCNIRGQRNLKYVQLGDDLVAVPYDFDHAALVKAPYARVNPDYNQKRIEDRHSIGKFLSQEQLDEMATEFLALKDTGFSIYKDCFYLTNKSKAKMEKYLEGFYKDIQDKKRMKRAFLAK